MAGADRRGHEYRHIKPYWTKRLEKVSVPFEIVAAERNESGSDGADPQKTKDQRAGEYRLHIKKVLGYRHWDKRRKKPKR